MEHDVHALCYSDTIVALHQAENDEWRTAATKKPSDQYLVVYGETYSLTCQSDMRCIRHEASLRHLACLIVEHP